MLSSNSSKKRTKQFDHSTVRQKHRIFSFFFWKNRQLEKNITTLPDLYEIKRLGFFQVCGASAVDMQILSWDWEKTSVFQIGISASIRNNHAFEVSNGNLINWTNWLCFLVKEKNHCLKWMQVCQFRTHVMWKVNKIQGFHRETRIS